MVPPGPLTKHQQQQTNKPQPTARRTPPRPTPLQSHPRRKPNTPPAPTRLNGRGQGFWSGFERSEARKKPWPRPKAEPPQKQSQPPPKAKLPQKQRRRSEEHTSELQSRGHLVCRLLLEKKKQQSRREIEISTH